ncbi:MAG: FAD-dependent oxidoreductase [Nitriliruptorales bacterium]|nr:FAD-dependent oxidoreductase [Nitriliruptorales bacterium]
MRVAVVGTGIAGLVAAWLLDRQHEVHVFEQRDRLGGHTHTMSVGGGRARTSPANRLQDAAPGSRPGQAGLAVDTGFIVYNEPTYPGLTRLFDELQVETEPSDMSWAVSCRRCDLEYAGSVRGITAQPTNLLDPSYLRFLGEIDRFNRVGRKLVDDPRTERLTIGRFLHNAGFGHGLRDHYLLPMAAAIWSTGAGRVEDFPLATLLRFFRNHGLLGVTGHHPWRTVTGGASSYIPKLVAGYRDRVHTGDGVVAVDRDPYGVDLRLASGDRHRFDRIVIAAHADQALGMLADPSRREKELLGEWGYSDNDAWFHTDTSLLPNRQRAWASWNYLVDDCTVPGERVSLSYHMNRLQNLDTPEQYVVTLNPPTEPARDRVLARMTYRHPAYTPASVGTQGHLDELNGRNNTFYVGAYQRYGFHEDGVWSAQRAVSHFGIRWP